MARSLASPSSTTFRAVGILILGAALSSGILAAPTRCPMIPSSIGARDLQSQSSSDGLGTLSEGQTRRLATLQRDSAPRQTVDASLTIDDPEYVIDSSYPNVTSVSVSLDQPVALLKRGQGGSREEQEPKKEKKKKWEIRELRMKAPHFMVYFEEIDFAWMIASGPHANEAIRKAGLLQVITDDEATLQNEVIPSVEKGLQYNLKEYRGKEADLERMRTLASQFSAFWETELENMQDTFPIIQHEWSEARNAHPGPHRERACRAVFNERGDDLKWIYEVASIAEKQEVIDENTFKPYKELYQEWNRRYNL
ncbi:hypothetical protein C8R42DRAFT_190761 [Lentinula raphanica]|nr:hypothetical protein C8R42DRAFT_190761 [Lentinula raphanica]